MDPIDYVWNQIEDADLSAPVYRTAIRLLRMAICNPSGYVWLTKAGMREICGTEADGTMRAHLSQLSCAGIIHYSTNEFVYITFVAWTRDLAASTRAERANASHNIEPGEAIEVVEGDSSRDLSASTRDVGASTRAQRANASHNNHSSSHARVGWLVGFMSREIVLGSLPTNQPTPDPSRSRGAGVCARVREFLLDDDVGMPADWIEELPAMTFRRVVQITFEWLHDYRKSKVGIGALRHRLKQKRSAPPLRDADRQSSLCRRLVPEAYRPPDSEKNYAPDEYSDVIIS